MHYEIVPVIIKSEEKLLRLYSLPGYTAKKWDRNWGH